MAVIDMDRERRALQWAVAALAIIPVAAGLYGVLFGPALTVDRATAWADSHYRQMSGLLFGAGLCLLSTVPAIEQRTGRFRLLVLLIFIAGIGRLIGFFLTGIASFSVVVGLTLELFVAPILALWQTRVANRYAETAGIADLNKDAI
ncbi:MAG TPA: DUF4345 domain-containing protein [Beijerinckiaceae bacterium]|jgi:hypothetical protein